MSSILYTFCTNKQYDMVVSGICAIRCLAYDVMFKKNKKKSWSATATYAGTTCTSVLCVCVNSGVSWCRGKKKREARLQHHTLVALHTLVAEGLPH